MLVKGATGDVWCHIAFLDTLLQMLQMVIAETKADLPAMKSMGVYMNAI